MRISNPHRGVVRANLKSILTLFRASNITLLFVVLFVVNSLNAQTKTGNQPCSTISVSVFGGFSFEAENKNEMVESTIEVGGIFFNNNTEEQADYKQFDTYAIGSECMYLFNEKVSAGLMFIYKPEFKGEYFVEDIMQDGILGKFKINMYILQTSFRYTESINEVLTWNATIGAGYVLRNREVDFYGTVCGNIGPRFAAIDENDGAVCASASISASMNLFDNFNLVAKGMILKYFGDFSDMQSSIISAGVEYNF